MATQAQMNANRANAQKSTGPSTDTGKARTSQNALKTGIYAESEVTKHENPEQLIQLTTEYYDQHQPATAEARQMVDELIQSAWRTRRITRGEARLWDYLYSQTENTPEHLREGHAFFLGNIQFARIERMLQSVSRRSRQIEDKLHKLEAAPVAEPQPEPPAPPAESSTAQPTESATTSPEIGFVSSGGFQFPTEAAWRLKFGLLPGHPLNHRDCPHCGSFGRERFNCKYEVPKEDRCG